MYADGDGVQMSKARAYDYFRRLTSIHADDSSGTPNARFLANAFVTLGQYYLDGIPGTLKADPNVAREMFRYAASYFGDPEAQYYLGRLYLFGKGAPKDAITAARWLVLSAKKGDTPGAGLARRHAVQGRGSFPPGGARAVLAHYRQGRRRSGRKLDHRHVRDRCRAGQRQ